MAGIFGGFNRSFPAGFRAVKPQPQIQHMKRLLFLLLVQLVHSSVSNIAIAQCRIAPVIACSAGPAAFDGEILPAGTTKWVNGGTMVFGDYTLRGGTLVVCNDLQIDRFTMDSGIVFVQPGSRLVIANGTGAGLVFRGNCAIYNYGILEIQRNLSLENGWASAATPNVIINAGFSSQLKMQNQYFVINNAYSWFVNNGKAFFHGIITDPQAVAGSVCLGTSSQTNMTVLYNKVRNAYMAPDGAACVRVSEFTQLWDTLTRYPQVNVCLGVGHRMDSSCRIFGCKPHAWGAASLFRNCSSCDALQVVDANGFLSLAGVAQQDRINLTWQLPVPADGGHFILQHAKDGQAFSTIAVQPSHAGQQQYTATDLHPFKGSNYYRVAYTTPGGQAMKQSPVCIVQQRTLSIYCWPSPVKDLLTIQLPPGQEPFHLSLNGTDGRVLLQSVVDATESTIRWSLPSSIPPGIYVLRVRSGKLVTMQKIVKE